MTPPPVLVSIVPNLMRGEGHMYDYHRSLGHSAALLGWQHLALVPPNSGIPDLPDSWSPQLAAPDLEAETNPLLKMLNLWGIYQWATCVATYLRNVAASGQPTIVFMERFIPSQLLGLTIALCQVPNTNLALWLFYRRDVHRLKIRPLYRVLNGVMQRRLRPGRFRLLTDSEQLATAIGTYFQQPLTVMPIPHTALEQADPFPNPNDNIIAWWAGAPRQEKGWDIIRHLTTRTDPDASKICLVAAQSAGLAPVPGGIQVMLTADRLSRHDYLRWLMTSDLVLLPYDADAYRERTSGVFVECIIAGKVPVVTAGTWMAYELERYQLHPLIVDWHHPHLLQHLCHLAQDPTIATTLTQMQAAYHTFHTPKTYAQLLNQQFLETFSP